MVSTATPLYSAGPNSTATFTPLMSSSETTALGFPNQENLCPFPCPSLYNPTGKPFPREIAKEPAQHLVVLGSGKDRLGRTCLKGRVPGKAAIGCSSLFGANRRREW